MDEEFQDQPLSDIWDKYTESLDQAISSGYLRDEETSDDYVWPPDLHFDEWEQEDVKRYISERISELVDRQKERKILEPNLIAGYLFRSVLAGMLWQTSRIGR